MIAKWVGVFGVALFFNANIVESFPIVTTVSGICPQNRKTERAPGRYLEKVNPLAPNKNIEKGRNFFPKMRNRPSASSVMGARETAMAVSQGGWIRLPEILLVEV